MNQEGFLLQLKDDEIRKHSTSGGAFTAIASWVIRQGGVVFGAAMNVDTFEVHHQSTETIEGLEVFRISKYVQSHVDDCFLQVRDLLKAKEMLGMRMCVLHNLYFYNTMMEEIRDSLDKGQFAAYKKQKLENMATPLD